MHIAHHDSHDVTVGAPIWSTMLGLILAAGVAVLVIQWPRVALPAVVLTIAIGALVMLARRTTSTFCVGAFVLLAGYMGLTRGFSGLNIPAGGLPVYVGEIALALLLPPSLARLRGVRLPLPIYLLGAWMVYCSILSLRQLGTYGIDTIRDSAIWYYGLYALVGIAIWRSLDVVIIRRWLTPVFLFSLVAAPIGLLGERLPLIQLPFSDTTIFATKMDVIAMHLLGAAVFFMAGQQATGMRRMKYLTPAVFALAIAFTALSGQRAAFTGLVGVFAIMVLYRMWRSILVVVGSSIAVVAILWMMNFEMETEQGVVTVQSIVERQVSTVTFLSGSEERSAEDVQNSATIYWRVLWWQALMDEAFEDLNILVFGRGFGPDLREAILQRHYAGHNWEQGTEDGRPVRSPHSIAMTVLARAGIIGLAGWLLFLSTSFWQILHATLRRRRAGDRDDEIFGVWLLLHLTLITLVALFGVVLEAPHGAVPFFLFLGLGLGWSADRIAMAMQPAPLTARAQSAPVGLPRLAATAAIASQPRALSESLKTAVERTS